MDMGTPFNPFCFQLAKARECIFMVGFCSIRTCGYEPLVLVPTNSTGEYRVVDLTLKKGSYLSHCNII